VIARDSFVAALPKTHRLARRTVIDPRRLADEPFISFRPGSVGDQWVRTIGRSAGFEPNLILTSEVGSSIAQLIGDGLGVTFLQKNTIGKMLTHDVTFVELDPPVELTAALCWDGRKPQSSAAREFREFVLARAAACDSA